MRNPIDRDLGKKLWDDITRSIDHYATLAEIADVSGADQFATVSSILMRMLLRIWVTTPMMPAVVSRELFDSVIDHEWDRIEKKYGQYDKAGQRAKQG